MKLFATNFLNGPSKKKLTYKPSTILAADEKTRKFKLKPKVKFIA
jgi:hypothetical protein